MPSLGPQQGEELGGGGGRPPAWPSPITPTLVECEEDEGRGERGALVLQEERAEETDVRSWKSAAPASLLLAPHTTDFMSNINV